MESHEVSHGTEKGPRYLILRCSFALIFTVIASLVLIFVAVFFVILVGDSSISSPISVPVQCKIVSSSVDLRSSKVCELGLFNYKAKHVFYPSETKKYRCHYDYYWASVFMVEYKEHSSGQTQQALAEAPNEALPLDCRPNFGAAWLTKNKFKVNETYNCWYTPGISKVNIHYHRLFNCQAKDPSMIEMIRRYSTLSSKILSSWFTNQRRAKYLYRETLAGIITGALTSLISISLVKFLHGMKSRITQKWEVRTLVRVVVFRNHFNRACLLVAYFSVMGWLTIQYWKLFGLPKIFTKS